MIDYIFFGIGLVILVVALVLAFRRRHTTSQCISCILLGVFLAEICMVLPTQWKGGESAYSELFYRVLYSMFFGFDVIKGDMDILQLETIQLRDTVRDLYFVLNYVIFFLSPILTSGLILSFIGDMGEKMRYALHFSRQCHVFSELNENAVSLAKGIRKKDGKTTIVFCGTKGAEEHLTSQVKRIGGILLYKKCENFAPGFKHRNYTYYLISQDEDRNVRIAETLIRKNRDVKEGNLTINAFAESGTNISLIENMPKGSIRLRFIDEIALFCNHLIFENPLYNVPEGRKDISVLLVGCGRTGMQMLKTVAWCGQIQGYDLHIRVLDKNAEGLERVFYGKCPELKNQEYDIRFCQADVSSDFTIPEDFCATYVVVATGDDALNLAAADKIRGILRRQDNCFDNDPPIFARVRSGIKTENFAGSEYLAQRNIHLFGTTESMFAENTLFNTRLERLALAVHLSYCGVLEAEPESEAYQQACRSFEASEYSRRSSMAVALHIPAKLHTCGLMAKDEHLLTEEKADLLEKALASDVDLTDMLAKNEHIRWNAFIRSEGFRRADVQTMKAYAPKVGHQREDMAKLHLCLAPWEELDDLAGEYNALMHTHKDFKQSDRMIVARIPQILRFQ